MDADTLNYIIELDKKGDAQGLNNLFLSLLEKEPNNLEVLFRMAVLQTYPPYVEGEASMFYVNRILSIDPNNVKALLLAAYVYFYLIIETPLEFINKIKFLHSSDNELQSMIEYVKSWHHYDDKDKRLYEECLLKSIQLNPKVVWSYRKLATLYAQQNKIIQAQALLKKALQNVKEIIDLEGNNLDSTNIDLFLDNGIKGTRLGSMQYELIKGDLNELENRHNS